MEQLAPLHLAKEHLPSDIIDILERLRKANNIPFNYYIAENCADRYYSKVIKTFVFLIKRQFADRQTCFLKFLEEYADRQAQIWKVLRKYHNLPDKVDDLDNFITHHNTHQESEWIRQEYFATLQNLSDNEYYTEIEESFNTTHWFLHTTGQHTTK